jgi:hypothetical protein
MARKLILGLMLTSLCGCAGSRGKLADASNASNSPRELDGAEFLRDTLYDATIHGRGMPDDYGQSIYAP